MRIRRFNESRDHFGILVQDCFQDIVDEFIDYKITFGETPSTRYVKISRVVNKLDKVSYVKSDNEYDNLLNQLDMVKNLFSEIKNSCEMVSQSDFIDKYLLSHYTYDFITVTFESKEADVLDDIFLTSTDEVIVRRQQLIEYIKRVYDVDIEAVKVDTEYGLDGYYQYLQILSATTTPEMMDKIKDDFADITMNTTEHGVIDMFHYLDVSEGSDDDDLILRFDFQDGVTIKME